MTLQERIATFQKKNYDRWYWWRRFQPRQTLHKYNRLSERIPNGDFEVSDYYYQLKYEDVLEQEELTNEINPDRQHEIRSLYGERKRRLTKDYETDEAKILADMYKAFWNEFRMTQDQVEEEMLNFDGGLAEFVDYLSSKQKIKICHAVKNAY
jgi:hypothetical protein